MVWIYRLGDELCGVPASGSKGIIAARKEIVDRVSRFNALSNRLVYVVQAALEQFHEARRPSRS